MDTHPDPPFYPTIPFRHLSYRYLLTVMSLRPVDRSVPIGESEELTTV
jgi:hypothetical protein